MAKRQKKKDESDLVQLDGALALTFVNTGSRRSPPLRDYADLVRWAVTYGALAAADGIRLEERAAECPEDAGAAFAAAQQLHALLSRILNDCADRRVLPVETVRELNDLLARVAPRRIMAPGAARLAWAWPSDAERDFYRPLWSVGLSASTVLTSEDYGRVKRCAAEDCDVLFLAKGRGPTRKWCSSESCGAPFRSRKHYRRVTKRLNQGRRPVR